MNCVSGEDKIECVNMDVAAIRVYCKIATVRIALWLVKSSSKPHTRALYLVNKPLSTAGISDDNFQSWKK